MWNYAHDRRSMAGYTSEKTSGWICSRITKDRCRRSGHGNTSPIPKIATRLSKHISLIKSGMRWRKRLILVDIIMQVETLSTHNWKNKSWTCSSNSSAWMHTPHINFSALYRHTHTLSSAIKHRSASTPKRKTDSSTYSPAPAEADLAPLCNSCSPAKDSRGGGERGRLGISRLSTLSSGL